MKEADLKQTLAGLRPEPASTTGPLVSIVVTNRDDATCLRRLLDGLAHTTDYEPIELVLVDNGSSDESLEEFDAWTGTKVLVANHANRSFSEANNQGIRAASGEYVLLLNNDVEPIDSRWLGYMVDSLSSDVTAVGALLVYPERSDARDLSIQHSGIKFESSPWGVRATNQGAGHDPVSIAPPEPKEVPAVTAACMMARRSDLLDDPLDENYWYGSEDWDLCMRLGNRGRIILDERSVLFHKGSETQKRYMSAAWLERRTENHIWFNGLWGPALLRALRAEVTAKQGGWFFRGHDEPTVAVTAQGAEAETLADHVRMQAQAGGWNVVDRETNACEVAIAVSPPEDVQRFVGRNVSIALVVDRQKEWVRTGALDAAKRVLVPDRLARARLDTLWGSGIAELEPGVHQPDQRLFERLIEGSQPTSTSMRIGVATCAPDWARSQVWGDTHLARGLIRGFRRLGHESLEVIREDWNGNGASSCDVVIHLRGLWRRQVARGQWNLLWIISHPDRIEPGEPDDYDLIASASRRHAEELTAHLGRQVHFLPQATDVDTFRLGGFDPDYETDVLYVGNARVPHRRAPRWMMRSRRRFDLYGQNWESNPEGSLRTAVYIANRDLAGAYRSAKVVVADHHESMRRGGFLANRLFDVPASGGVVLSDDVSGISDLFGDSIPTYSNAEELESQLRILLEDPKLRRRLARETRTTVLAGHTLDHRARQWLDLLDAV